MGQSVPRIVHATGPGATQAGLELGRLLAGDSNDIVGVDVAQLVPGLSDEVAALVRDAGSLIGFSSVDVDPIVDSRYFGEGYGTPTTQSTKALGTAARIGDT